MSSQICVLAIIYLPLLINCVNGLKNVNNLQQFIAPEKIQAEFYSYGSYFQTYDDCTQEDSTSIIYLGQISTVTYLEYEEVDFSYGVEQVSFRLTNVDPSAAVTIDLHLSKSTDPPFLTVPINSTGSDKCAFVTVNVTLGVVPSGKHTLYITFPSGDGGQLFLDWFQFSETSGGIIPATEIIQAEDFDYAEEMSIYKDNCSDVAIVADSFYNVAEYYQVDFGDGVQSVTVRLSSTGYFPDELVFYGGSSGDTLIAILNYNDTGGSCDFVELSADVITLPTGVQNLYLVDHSGYYAYVDSFVFTRKEGLFNATDKIEAENYSSIRNASAFQDCSDPSVIYVEAMLANVVLEYDRVDFGSGVEIVTLRVSSMLAGAPLVVALSLGSSTSTPFVVVQVGQTGSERCDFYTISVFLDTRPSGVQNLFITFPSAQGVYLHLDWFSFSQTVN